jgi:hypothetical protein
MFFPSNITRTIYSKAIKHSAEAKNPSPDSDSEIRCRAFSILFLSAYRFITSCITATKIFSDPCNQEEKLNRMRIPARIRRPDDKGGEAGEWGNRW